MRDVVYHLRSTWDVPAPAPQVWQVLADPAFSWPRWWPGLVADTADVVPSPSGARGPSGTPGFSPGPTADVGSRVRVRFRSPLGYALRLVLVLAEVDAPRRAVLAVDGDLVGTGTVVVAGTTTSRVDVAWDVATRRRWMNVAAPVLGGAFAAAHGHVMRAGERGLVAHLAAGGR